ncbi:signal peptidase I [Patescibacteria group bacterium]|nr:signal peptidase I [Patescibacteria group bacterium]
MIDEQEEKDNLDIELPVGKKEKNFLATTATFFLELIKIVILAGVTIGVVRYFLFKPFYVKGQSMEPNYLEKDYLIIDELSYRFREPQRGEVVVFKAPAGNKDFYLKRILGLPGERIKIEDKKVIIYNDDHPQGIVVEELYLDENTSGSIIQTLGPDQYFVMGDNRDSSYDSRRFGPIDRKNIVGRSLLRGWPFTRVTKFTKPGYNL